jgi:hypothetical protein
LARKSQAEVQLDKLFGQQKSKRQDKKNKKAKYGRNLKKCAKYRARVGKPNGPGQPGNKAGRKAS